VQEVGQEGVKAFHEGEWLWHAICGGLQGESLRLANHATFRPMLLANIRPSRLTLGANGPAVYGE
jgi:hypothetical protein